jgi:hypothetical protein
MDNLIPKDALLDAIEDDDDIERNTDPSEYPDRADRESSEEFLALIHFAGRFALQAALRALCLEYSDIFATSVRHRVQSMVLDIDHSKWEAPRHSTEKKAAICSQIDSLLALGVIEESRASYWSQLHIHMVRKPTPGEWRMIIDFVQLDAATRGLEGWSNKHWLDWAPSNSGLRKWSMSATSFLPPGFLSHLQSA